eukprot:TRINITY_DN1896_c0_g1_i2.p1 TRINITY_DN1896_c0_g1~~TRINITY_DN1896_c0_g1_i2.p1  ORF type:complete len:383 (+),score=109.63 TRINITY_DN1896_c0_g1_i2:276-1424(+)
MLPLEFPGLGGPSAQSSHPSLPGMGLWLSIADSMERVCTDKASVDKRDAGCLDQHFKTSAFFDETSCRHDYKLVGSKIYSSGRFQEQMKQDAEDAATSRNASGGGSLASLKSIGSGGSLGKRRGDSTLSVNSESDPWGWFEDPETDAHGGGSAQGCADTQHETAPGGGTPVKETPIYVLTESLSAQRLWHQTAGRRPRQPSQERTYFEQVWEKNFGESEVDYTKPLPSDRRSSRKGARPPTRVLYRATSPFGSAVSKSFKCENCGEISSIMVHIPKFQIVQSGSDVHAEYLIVVGLGAVTLGVWRRFREFKNLANKLEGSNKRQQFHNALCSWHCLRARQRLFRCLDKDYLILKCFLLERFLHDLVFESMSPDTVREFLGVL